MGSTEEATLIGGTQYLRIQMIGIPAVALTSVVTATMRGIGNSRIAMIYNIIANVVNVIFNYLLIGGNLGFPRPGRLSALRWPPSWASLWPSASLCI